MTLALAALVASVIGIVGAAAPTVIKETITPPDVTVSSERIDDETSTVRDSSLTTEDVADNTEDQVLENHGAMKGPSTKEMAEQSGAVEREALKSFSSAITKPASTGAVPSMGSKQSKAASGQTADCPNPKIDVPSVPVSQIGGKKSSDDSDFDVAEFTAVMKDVGDDVSASTKEAFQEIAKAIHNKDFIEGLNKLTKASTQAAMKSASKATKEQIEAALKSLKSIHLDHIPPPGKQPH